MRRVVDEAIGLGPIEPLLGDASISEVMVNAPDEVYYERDGVMYLSDVRFRDKVHIMRIIDRIIAPLGRRVDESIAIRGRPSAGRLARQRHHPAAGAEEPHPDDTQVPARQVHRHATSWATTRSPSNWRISSRRACACG